MPAGWCVSRRPPRLAWATVSPCSAGLRYHLSSLLLQATDGLFGLRVPGVSGLVIPGKGLLLILLDALAVLIHAAQVELRPWLILLSSLAKPSNGLLVVPLDAPSCPVQHAKGVLRDS